MNSLGEISYEVVCDFCNREMKLVEVNGKRDFHMCAPCGVRVRYDIAYSVADALLSKFVKYMLSEGLDIINDIRENRIHQETRATGTSANGFHVRLKFGSVSEEGG